mmetsp:Transcript_17542/g.22237  ORF Transcript_17542/g.22237 Transcript_17542/m.22237 type:complete len:176 (-) Transcript_17542:224-751(-)
MKFAKACMLAASASTVANGADATIQEVLNIFSSGFLSDTQFYKGLLLNMQRDSGNLNTDCVVGYDDFLTLYANLKTELQTDVSYYASLKGKGQGDGSAFGFQLSKGSKYIDLLASGINVYNQCDVDYYMRALSKATSNVSGIANQLVNIYWRTDDVALYNNLATAFTSKDVDLGS